MAKGWYVVHTYSGYENKVQKHLARIMESQEFKEQLFDVKVPQEEVVEVRDGKKRVTSKKFLPGYILLEMDLGDARWKELTSSIRRIQGVTAFVGAQTGRKPQPISGDEVRSILQKSGAIKNQNVRPRQTFSLGEPVRIVDGPFDSFTGTVEEVNLEKGKLRVSVGIFGRSTPVELDFLQVEKV